MRLLVPRLRTLVNCSITCLTCTRSYKVYLIDEVHMLSTHSFNALLKTLKSHPNMLNFYLRLLSQNCRLLYSRCLQFVLRPLTPTAISEHLAKVLSQEEYIRIRSWQLAQAAKGSVRDALSLTDQAIGLGKGRLVSRQ